MGNNDKLFFNNVEVSQTLEGEFVVKPNFNCPVCNRNVKPTDKVFTKNVDSNLVRVITAKDALVEQKINEGKTKEEVLALKEVVEAKDTLNINQQVNFTMPCCGTKITLYVAIYKSEKDAQPQISISTEPIPSNWYSRLRYANP